MAVGADADVIVVGAGPSGSSAARCLAEAGVDVILLDKSDFPRVKTCGGGIIGVTRDCVPLGAPYVAQIYEATFSLRGKQVRHRTSREPIMATVKREEFDNWLLGLAKSQGVDFRPKTKVSDVREADDRVVVSTDSCGKLSSRFLIDGSGAYSTIAKQLNVTMCNVDLGFETELAITELGDWTRRIHLDWGPIPGSYGWVFPKGDSLNVGVIAPVEAADSATVLGSSDHFVPSQYLAQFIQQLGLQELEVLKKPKGHKTQCRSEDSPLGIGRILLIGDSAGLLEPWTREGLSFATRSGSAAASAVSGGVRRGNEPRAVQEDYRRQLENSVLEEMRVGFDALTAFSKHPQVFHWLLGSTSLGWRYFGRITSGDTNLARAGKHASVRFGLSLLGGEGNPFAALADQAPEPASGEARSVQDQ